jgi:hypothetical protein
LEKIMEVLVQQGEAIEAVSKQVHLTKQKQEVMAKQEAKDAKKTRRVSHLALGLGDPEKWQNFKRLEQSFGKLRDTHPRTHVPTYPRTHVPTPTPTPTPTHKSAGLSSDSSDYSDTSDEDDEGSDLNETGGVNETKNDGMGGVIKEED